MNLGKTSLLLVILPAVVIGCEQRPKTSDTQSAEDRPNVIVIISDDQGWADIGYNNPKVYTPNLDKLANSGAKLTRHYVMPKRMPARGLVKIREFAVY